MTHYGSLTSSDSSYGSSNSDYFQSGRLRYSEMEPHDRDQIALMQYADERKWNANCAKCLDCEETVPHSLLYVCHYARCHGYFEEDDDAKYRSPFEFYQAEKKVFCSACTFTGQHRDHAYSMEEAQAVATRLSLKDWNLQRDFAKLAWLDNDDPLDCMLQSEFNVQNLPVLRVAEYLVDSQDSAEWDERMEVLDNLKKTAEQCRLDAANKVKELAAESLAYYQEFAKFVEESIKKDEEAAKAEKKAKKSKRRANLGGAFAPIARCEELKPTIEKLLIPEDDVTPIVQMKEEPVTPTSEPAASQPPMTMSMVTVKNEVDEAAARMICRNLSLSFDQIRDDMDIEQALQKVSDELHGLTGTLENKVAAARLFREKNNVALYYPPQ